MLALSSDTTFLGRNAGLFAHRDGRARHRLGIQCIQRKGLRGSVPRRWFSGFHLQGRAWPLHRRVPPMATALRRRATRRTSRRSPRGRPRPPVLRTRAGPVAPRLLKSLPHRYRTGQPTGTSQLDRPGPSRCPFRRQRLRGDPVAGRLQTPLRWRLRAWWRRPSPPRQVRTRRPSRRPRSFPRRPSRLPRKQDSRRDQPRPWPRARNWLPPRSAR